MEYKVTAVSPQTKEWASQYGPMVTYYVKLEGREDLPVQVNKKASSPAPQVGDVLNGEITRTEYGDKFKAAPKPFGGESPKLDQILKELAEIKHIIVHGDTGSQGGGVEVPTPSVPGATNEGKSYPASASGYEQAKAKAEEIKSKQEDIEWT